MVSFYPEFLSASKYLHQPGKKQFFASKLIIQQEIRRCSKNIIYPTLIIFELCRVALIKSRLLNRSTLASTLIGIIPADPDTNEEKYEIGTASLVVQVNQDKMYFIESKNYQFYDRCPERIGHDANTRSWWPELLGFECQESHNTILFTLDKSKLWRDFFKV